MAFRGVIPVCNGGNPRIRGMRYFPAPYIKLPSSCTKYGSCMQTDLGVTPQIYCESGVITADMHGLLQKAALWPMALWLCGLMALGFFIASSYNTTSLQSSRLHWVHASS